MNSANTIFLFTKCENADIQEPMFRVWVHFPNNSTANYKLMNYFVYMYENHKMP